MSIQKLFPYTLWLFNIAMENDTFIDVCFDDLPIYVYIYTQMLRGAGISSWMVVQ